MAFLDPSGQANAHHSAAKAYEALYHDAGTFCHVDSLSSDVDDDDKLEDFRSLADTLKGLNKSCPVISRYALRRPDRLMEQGKGEVVRDYDRDKPCENLQP
jgi:hypothetical protein